MPPAAILDVDGTLVDTNYQHVIAWYRAFKRHDIVLPLWRIHRHIGMGGDQVVGALAGEEVERVRGDDIRAAEKELYFELIDEVEPFEGARLLIERLKERGQAVVLASSAKAEEVDRYLDLLGARELADGWTSPVGSRRRRAATPAPSPCSSRVPSAASGGARLRWPRRPFFD